MAAPVAIETWNNLHISATAAALNDRRRELMFKIKDALITGVNQGEWTVAASSDSVVADTNDNWIAETNLVWNTAGNIHSWIVLQQAKMGGGFFQLCIDLNYVYISSNKAEFYVSHSGAFVNGTITNRPTATDEQFVNYNTQSSWGPGTNLVSMGANILKTTSGKCTRVLVNIDGDIYGYWIIDEPKDKRDFWDTPYIALVTGEGRIPSYDYYFNYAIFHAQVDAENLKCFLTCEGFGIKQALPEDVLFGTSDYNSEWVCCPAGIMSNSTTRRGRLGEVKDWWWVSDNLNTGDCMPGDASKAFVVIGEMLQPWDGSAMVID